MSKIKVLMVGPGRQVRGGIRLVIQNYTNWPIWKEYSCYWLETYDDRGSFRKIWAFLRAFVQAFSHIFSCNIVHIHAVQNISFYRKIVFFLMAKLTGRKTILHLHAPYPNDFQKFPLNVVSRWVFRRADRVIALSQTWAREVKRIAPKANVEVIHNPCELPAQVPEPIAKRKPVILFSGKLEPRKGFGDLIRAMPAIISRVPEARLVMAGHGALEEAKTLAHALGVEKRVDFLGWVTADAKQKVLLEAKVFCLPSYGEGVPMAMLEAMAYRVPVVVTPVGGIPDVITDNWNGLFVTPGRVDEIAATVVRVLTNSVLGESLSERAYETVRDKFSPDVICRRIGQLYEQVCGNIHRKNTTSV